MVYRRDAGGGIPYRVSSGFMLVSGCFNPISTSKNMTSPVRDEITNLCRQHGRGFCTPSVPGINAYGLLRYKTPLKESFPAGNESIGESRFRENPVPDKGAFLREYFVYFKKKRRDQGADLPEDAEGG